MSYRWYELLRLELPLILCAACRTLSVGADSATLGDETLRSLPMSVAGMRSEVLAHPETYPTISSVLPALDPQLRSTYLLLFHSKSRQSATFTAPRVVLFGPDAHLMVAFNGSRGEAGYSLLEMIEWNPEQQTFDFYEAREQAGHLLFSEKNPPICGGCHTNNMGDDDPRRLRPNWESFDAWPGAYGGASGLPLGKYLHIASGSDEEAGLDHFKTVAEANDRYKVLLNLDKKFVGFNASDVDASPNNIFGERLKVMNGQRLARWLTEDPDYASMRPALVHALSNCDDFETLMPDNLKVAEASSVEDLVEEAVASYHDNPTNLADSVIQDVTATTLRPLARVRRLFQLKGTDINHWTLSPTIKDSFLDVRGEGLIKAILADPAGFLVPELQKLDGDFALVTCPR